MSNKCLAEVIGQKKTLGKYQAFTVPIRRRMKALELGAWCLTSEAFLCLSGVIHLIGQCLIDEVLRYHFF